MDENFSQSVQCDTALWTAPFKCAVKCCQNTFTRYDPKDLIKYHDFPANVELQHVWLQKCSLQSDFCVDSAKVCTIHFLPSDYEALSERHSYYKVLKSTAVPTQVLTQNEIPETTEIIQAINENLLLKQTYNQLQEEKETLVTKLTRIKKRHLLKKKKLMILKKQCEQLRKYENCNPDSNLLSQVFSQSQINTLSNKNKVVWSNDDMAMAFTLRQMGNRDSYLYLKYTLNFPLPSLSSVQRWAASIS